MSFISNVFFCVYTSLMAHSHGPLLSALINLVLDLLLFLRV